MGSGFLMHAARAFPHSFSFSFSASTERSNGNGRGLTEPIDWFALHSTSTSHTECEGF
jgi:hypothetical protein